MRAPSQDEIMSSARALLAEASDEAPLKPQALRDALRARLLEEASAPTSADALYDALLTSLAPLPALRLWLERRRAARRAARRVQTLARIDEVVAMIAQVTAR